MEDINTINIYLNDLLEVTTEDKATIFTEVKYSREIYTEEIELNYADILYCTDSEGNNIDFEYEVDEAIIDYITNNLEL